MSQVLVIVIWPATKLEDWTNSPCRSSFYGRTQCAEGLSPLATGDPECHRRWKHIPGSSTISAKRHVSSLRCKGSPVETIISTARCAPYSVIGTQPSSGVCDAVYPGSSSAGYAVCAGNSAGTRLDPPCFSLTVATVESNSGCSTARVAVTNRPQGRMGELNKITVEISGEGGAEMRLASDGARQC
ncbi:hypothetical protein BO70DRAFT_358718 [Aspergillus heteromorphus CBS 117.55]|uniref:Uncharacterized protein n=1 Tax=Aspergillus heteromorphus CBS 117.55 TaxID=1448321 RepID=A0A317X2P5_9EURO|nr:uncharacterized protein BO70DRAFT_358718 [Aspergillus heteromorphus CBS 117.55]PWY91268.1 hypothetical protein BO70DRAFT_358718 [Aspergillus heteromorphus CBS 117.55]